MYLTVTSVEKLKCLLISVLFLFTMGRTFISLFITIRGISADKGMKKSTSLVFDKNSLDTLLIWAGEGRTFRNGRDRPVGGEFGGGLRGRGGPGGPGGPGGSEICGAKEESLSIVGVILVCCFFVCLFLIFLEGMVR